ncbi:hypothetical protein PR202_ga12382 [Eleusine coracana subsp. coracana]|uniref:BTB domain-containing protein n=1 Tax=Eleusine coracana subsp. coracana TaxID=191504 RepID=A0AAV5CBX2_ELECO|nr:hypothetical protein PR202_ga12382 [Eleusine coracana subsp. coracana]
MALQLILLSEPRADQVTATLSGRLVDPSGAFHPSTERIAALHSFKRPSDSSATLLIITASDVNSIRYYLKNNSVTVECTITVLNGAEGILPPFSNLQKDLGEFLQSEAGADVTFVVSGESFSAHKNVLAARSPVFMAEFFGAMKEKRSTRVEVKEMEAAVFKAMLHFIYTATVPELDEKQGSVVAMAQHLFVAADRYGLDSLKVLCKRRLTLGIATDTVATTLALAEQHGCSAQGSVCGVHHRWITDKS